MNDRSRQIARAERKAELARRSAQATEDALEVQRQLAEWVTRGEGEKPPALRVLFDIMHDSSVLVKRRFHNGECVSEEEVPRVKDELRVKVATELMNQARMSQLVDKSLGIKSDKAAGTVTNNTTYAQFNVTAEQYESLPADVRDSMADQQLRIIRGDAVEAEGG